MHNDIKDRFIESFVAAVKELKTGESFYYVFRSMRFRCSDRNFAGGWLVIFWKILAKLAAFE